jgi:apolipoprotein N-acyltransferase
VAEDSVETSARSSDEVPAASSPELAAAERVAAAPHVAVAAVARTQMHHWAIDLALVLVSAVLTWLAFAGNDIAPLAFVSLVPFLVALEGKTPRRAFWLGALQGLTLTMLGFSWLLDMLKTFSGFPTPLCFLFALIVNGYQGMRMAVLGWLYARGVDRGYRYDAVFIAAFVATEFLFPLLFPWYLSTCWHNVPILAQAADLGGPVLVSVIMLCANLAIAEVVLAFRQKRPWSRPIVALGVGLSVLNVAYGAIRIKMIDAQAATSDALRIGIVQGNMGLMQKRENPGEGVRRHERFTRELKEAGADLVVWSESSVTMPMAEDNFAVRYKQQLTGHLGIPTLFGAVIYTRTKPEKWFNTALIANAQGDIDPKLGRYDKQFLLAFGEYLPFGETFPKLYEWSPNSGRFSSGTINEPLRLTLKGSERKFTTLICYEDILPGFTRSLVKRADPDVLVNITNDAWFGDTAEPWQHLALAKFRAIEHHRYLVRSTNSGVSAIIDPLGRTVVNTKTFVADKAMADVKMMRGTTLYGLIGDVPCWLASLASIVMAFRWRKRKAADLAATSSSSSA